MTIPLLSPGDIFLTRNRPDVNNKSPGWWNHAAIYTGSCIIEAVQDGVNKVIAVKTEYFLNRYPEYLILGFKDSNKGVAAGNHAKTLLGKSYERYASILNDEDGDNCCSLISRCYNLATGQYLYFYWPDTILAGVWFYNDLYEKYHHKDYDNWTPPIDWYAGRIF